jgi:hypothetical protein
MSSPAASSCSIQVRMLLRGAFDVAFAFVAMADPPGGISLHRMPASIRA